MLILIEGHDGTGKTTLARKLVAATGAEYLHKSAPTAPTAYAEYVAPLEAGKSYVCDRWHLGELVYPAIYGRLSLYRCQRDFDTVDDLLASAGAIVVYTYDSPQNIADVLTRRGEDVDFDEIVQASSLWPRAIKQTVCPLMEVPFGEGNAAFGDIIRLATKQEATWTF